MPLPERTFNLPAAEDYTPPMIGMNMDFYHAGPEKIDLGAWVKYYRGPRAVLGAKMGRLAKVSLDIANHWESAAKDVAKRVAFPSPPEDRYEAMASTYNGLFTAALIAAEVHGYDFPIDYGIQQGLAVTVPRGGDTRGNYLTLALGLMEHGKKGLELIGEKNRRMVKRWAIELVPTPTSVNLSRYALGFGMGVIGSRNIQEMIIDARKAEIEKSLGGSSNS